MRLTPAQRIHAVCAFVVPIVLVLLFAPERDAAPAAAPVVEPCAVEPSRTACALADAAAGGSRD